MISYRLAHPRWPRVQLRLLAYRPKASALPRDVVKVVLQACEDWRPIAESPIAEENMTLLDLCSMLHRDMLDGWERESEASIDRRVH